MIREAHFLSSDADVINMENILRPILIHKIFILFLNTLYFQGSMLLKSAVFVIWWKKGRKNTAIY